MNNKQKMTRTTELLKEIEELYYDDGKCMFDDNDTSQWKAPNYLRLKGELRGRLDALKEGEKFLILKGHSPEENNTNCDYCKRLASIQEEIKLIESVI